MVEAGDGRGEGGSRQGKVCAEEGKEWVVLSQLCHFLLCNLGKAIAPFCALLYMQGRSLPCGLVTESHVRQALYHSFHSCSHLPLTFFRHSRCIINVESLPLLQTLGQLKPQVRIGGAGS